jgi:hypothetical protein
MKKNIIVVVVANSTGMSIGTMGKRILSLRETLKDQEFEFSTPELAQKFTNDINGRNKKGLTALFAGTELTDKELLVTEGVEPLTDVTKVEVAAKAKVEKAKAAAKIKAEKAESSKPSTKGEV